MVAMAADGNRSHTGSRCDCGCRSCRSVDLSLSSQRCASSCAARNGIAGGFQTGAAVAAGGRHGRPKMKAAKIAFSLAVFMALSLPAFAQSRRLMGGSAGGSKYQFFYETFLDPSMPELGNMSGGTIGGEGIIHRFMSDRRQRVFFGYDISIDVLPQANTYRITFSQLTPDSVRQVLGDDAASWTQLPAPDWGGPAVRIIREGEILALDLLTNSSTGQKIVDYVTVKGPTPKLAWDFIYETGTPRDFRVEDVALELRAPHVSVNGQVATSAIPEGV